MRAYADKDTIPGIGFESYYLQFVDAAAILESVTIIVKPAVYYSHRAVHLSPVDFDDADNTFWVHNIGVTKLGET